MINQKTTKEIVRGSVVSVKSNNNNSITDYHLINPADVWISQESLIKELNTRKNNTDFTLACKLCEIMNLLDIKLKTTTELDSLNN